MANVKKGKAQRVSSRWMTFNATANVLSAATKALNLPSDLVELVNGSVDPCDYFTPESFRRSYWKAEMFSKFPFPIPGLDRDAAARQAFLDAEAVCADTNSRFHDVFNRTDVPEEIRGLLLKAKRLLARLFDGFTVNEIAESARWGPGSSTSLPARFAAPQNKWALSSHITLDAMPYLDAFVGWSGWLPGLEPTLVKGNMVITVPKNSKTDRTIAIEPDWNCFFQLGLGGAIRRRLQRWGVLLPIAQSINQRLARSGSLDGFLATVDLKAASDTIALSVVEELLPADVVEHITALRSPSGSLDGGQTWFPYEKVSSMGNGFTFELETALFWALATAVAGHACAYGDDLIVPSTCVDRLQRLLSFCGFTVNTKKTHTGNSPFRESCGGHFFKGVDVSPVYVRDQLVGVTRVAFLNNLRQAISDQVLPEMESVWSIGKTGIPRLFMGPPDVDGVLHVPFDQALPSWRQTTQCWTGLRLIAEYDKGPATFQIGALRQQLFCSIPPEESIRFSYCREPGILKVRVKRWYSTWYGKARRKAKRGKRKSRRTSRGRT